MRETLVTVTGNVISDLRSRRTGDGARLVSFRLASNERRFDRDTETWVDGDRLFVTVTCWRRLAEGVAGSLAKGDPVVVTGRLFTRNYAVDGQRRSSTELDAYAVGPDLGRCTADIRRNNHPGVPAQRTSGDRGDPVADGAGQTADLPELAEAGGDTADLPDRVVVTVS